MEHYFDKLHGHCTPGICNTYQMAIYLFDNARFVELGTYHGKSTSFMAVEIINSGKNIKFDAIDTMRGSAVQQEGGGSDDRMVIDYGTFAREYMQNITPVKHIVRTLVMESKQAVDFYNDESIDFMFIDASHEYEDIKEDLTIWYPKIKKGGMFAGHDVGMLGVQEALKDVFHDYDILADDCWVIRKKK